MVWLSSFSVAFLCESLFLGSVLTPPLLQRAKEALGGAIPDPVVWNVRDVAPNKVGLL
jgi:hypothetical protein